MRQKDEAAHRSILERDRFIDLSDPAIVRAPSEEAIRAFYDSWEWKRCRYAVMQDKRFACMSCGADRDDGAKIVADHIKPLRWYWNRRLDQENIQILCADCNMGKGSRSQADFRRPSDQKTIYIPQAGYRRRTVRFNVPGLDNMHTYLGAQGCQNKLVATCDDLLCIAQLVFDLPPNLTYIDCGEMIVAMGRAQRCERAERNVPKYWPKPCDLWPADAFARVRGAARRAGKKP